MKRTCNHCRFAEPSMTLDKKPFLWCHRYPPKRIDDENGQVTTGMPPVGPLTWCGEFRLAWRRLFNGYLKT